MNHAELITVSYPLWQWVVGLVVLLWVWEKAGKKVWHKVWNFLTK